MYVIIITTVLLLLGTTTLKLAQDNNDMKRTNSISKKNFYIAEALSEEADVKLEECLRKCVYNSYEKILKYISDNNYGDMDIKVINRVFKSIFKSKFELSKDELENEDNYNLKIIEKYDILVEIKLEEDSDKEIFSINILSTYEDQRIIERIKTEYIIKFPEYDDFAHNKDLIEKINWVNYKW